MVLDVVSLRYQAGSVLVLMITHSLCVSLVIYSTLTPSSGYCW